MSKIDFVFPYVDGNEAIWQSVYKKERIKKNLPTNISKVRFREWENLKYLFRGIDKFLPWIGNVYMIVSNKEQVPSWINTDKVKIVLHSDIIPEEFLPTFNSTTIEMFLGNIKGLSEKFIYANDDMFVLREMKEDDFFINTIPKLSIKLDRGLETMFKKVEWHCLKTVGDYLGKILPNPNEQFIKICHTITPMCRETVKNVGNIFKKEIYDSCSQFRTEKNFNQYIYTYYQLLTGFCLDSETTYKYTSISPQDNPLEKAKNIARDIAEQKYDTICINDVAEFKSEIVFDTIKQIINSAFEKILPEKSKYELDTAQVCERKTNIFKWLNKVGATFAFSSQKEMDMFVEGVTNTINKILEMREEESSS